MKQRTWWIVLILFFAWTSYVAWSTSSFQDCIANEEKAEATAHTKNNPPEVILPLIAYARIDTLCAVRLAYDFRDALNTIATLFIALFTLTLWRSTDRLWKEASASGETALLTAKAAQKAADVAERSLTELERPYVYGAVTDPGLDASGVILKRSVFKLCIYNFGRTPANLTRLEYVLSSALHGSISSSIDPNVVGGRELPVGTIAANNDPFFETTNMFPMFIEQSDDIMAHKQSVWVVGFVRYADIFGDHYITGFTHVFDPLGRSFVRRGGEKYNYTRKEEPSKIPSPSVD